MMDSLEGLNRTTYQANERASALYMAVQNASDPAQQSAATAKLLHFVAERFDDLGGAFLGDNQHASTLAEIADFVCSRWNHPDLSMGDRVNVVQFVVLNAKDKAVMRDKVLPDLAEAMAEWPAENRLDESKRMTIGAPDDQHNKKFVEIYKAEFAKLDPTQQSREVGDIINVGDYTGLYGFVLAQARPASSGVAASSRPPSP